MTRYTMHCCFLPSLWLTALLFFSAVDAAADAAAAAAASDDDERNVGLPADCRQDPRWNNDSNNFCYEHVDAQWRQLADQRKPLAAVPHEPPSWRPPSQLEQVGKCLDEHFLSDSFARHHQSTDSDTENSDTESSSPVVDSKLDHAHGTAAMTVANVLNTAEIKAVQFLAACIRQHFPVSTERRVFDNVREENTGNDVVFLQQFLPLLLPGIVYRLYQALQVAVERSTDWKQKLYTEWITVHGGRATQSNTINTHTLIHSLGIRTTEHLNYQHFPGGLGLHEDNGSVFTILVLLSDPDEYQGGRFIVNLKDGGPGHVTLKAPRATGMVFLSSETSHGVTPLTGGIRQTFATEFWVYPDAPFGHLRPDNIRWEVYLDKLGHDPHAEFATEEEVEELWESGKSVWKFRYPDGPFAGSEYQGVDDDDDEEDEDDEDHDGSEEL